MSRNEFREIALCFEEGMANVSSLQVHHKLFWLTTMCFFLLFFFF